MTEIDNTARLSLLAPPAHGIADGSLEALAAYLHGLEARVAALERLAHKVTLQALPQAA